MAVSALTKPMVVLARPKPAPAPAAPRPSSPRAPVAAGYQLRTASGDIYNNVFVEKAVSDGIIISYAPENGGIAMTKIYFYELPSDLRERYEKKPANAGP